MASLDGIVYARSGSRWGSHSYSEIKQSRKARASLHFGEKQRIIAELGDASPEVAKFGLRKIRELTKVDNQNRDTKASSIELIRTESRSD